jgi:hypothetical protein
MRKILLVLMLAVSVLATQTQFNGTLTARWGTAGNWSGLAVPDTLDTCTIAAACTVNVAARCGKLIKRTPTVFIATGQTIYSRGGIIIDSASVLNLGNGLTLAGASDTLHLGTGLGTVTAASCEITMNGTTAMVLDDDKSITAKSLTLGASAVVTSSGAARTDYQGTSTLLTIGNNSTYTVSQNCNYIPTADFSIFSIGTGVTWGGNKTQRILASSSCSIPGFTYTGTGTFDISPTAASTVTQTGHINIGTSTLQIRVFDASCTYNTGGFNITCGPFKYGSEAGGKAQTINCGASIISITSFLSSYNTAASPLNMQTSKWTCSGDWTFGSNHTITASAGQIVNITGLSKITSNGKTFPGALTINNAAHTVDSLADSLDVAGDFTIQSGQFRQNGKPFAVHGDYYSLSSDTSNMNATKYLYKSWTRGAGSNAKNDTAITKLVSDNLCNLTTNTARLNYVHIKALSYGIQKVKQLDNAVIVRLRDTIGAWNQNGFTRSDSIAVWLDSGHIWNAARTCWKYSLYGPNFKATTLTDTLTYAGSAACSLVVSCVNTIGNVKVNLTGAGSLKQVGATHYGALNVADGILSPTDTIYATSLNWTSTDTSTLGVVIVSGSAYIAPTAKLGATKIIMLSQCSISGGNANLPPVTYPAGCGAKKRRNGWLGLGVNNGLMF